MQPALVRAGCDRRPELAEIGGDEPIELVIEATDREGHIAEWLEDEWWTAALERWAEAPVTIRIARTPQALLHPVLLYQLEMVRRVSPHWRIIGETTLSDVDFEGSGEQIAASPYHEVRVHDDSVHGTRTCDCTVDSLFGRIRRAQVELGVSRPVLVRVPIGQSRAASPSDPDPT